MRLLNAQATRQKVAHRYGNVKRCEELSGKYKGYYACLLLASECVVAIVQPREHKSTKLIARQPVAIKNCA